MGVGQYLDTVAGKNFPIIASSQDSGLTWSYTLSRATLALPADVNGDAWLYNTSWSGQNSLALGTYLTPNQYPLMATSTDGGLSWSYTIDSTTPMPPVNFIYGYLNQVACSGQRCVAGGAYNNGLVLYPLLATSTDGGLSWSYTINNLTPVLPGDYSSGGTFNGVSCSGLICVAAGNYNTAVTSFPLLATSNDGGLSWRYTIDSSTPALPIDFLNNGFFYSASCDGENCIASGSYNNGSTYSPLLASSRDGGATWAYTIDNTQPALPPDYNDNGQLYGTTSSLFSMLIQS